ncbi:hypothetical protein ACFX13_048115 [Malus domestica]|uniref:PsbQ-like protein 3, chloroplastic n=1 Tax=Malus domestica TaxID=3750 RepID=A0A498J4K1_MALDO|nr:hypothetical protein DVH24_035473 [Malus domestica]
MTFKPGILQHMNLTIACCLKQPYEFQQSREKPLPLKGFEFHVKRRRMGAMAAISWVALLTKEALFTEAASGFELPLVAPDQTVTEAEDEIRGHAQALLEVKDLIEFESWRELQAALRKSSSLLKQDFYTIIQGKPASERRQLRKLYTDLFNNVTRLDYAARDKDASYIRQCYDNIVCWLVEEIASSRAS